MKRLTTILALAMLSTIAANAANAADSGWPAVTVEMRPWTRWWWMGNAVDEKNLGEELARYHAAGIGGVEVTPIYGADGWESKYIDYLSPKWMSLLDYTITTATKLGMKVDMTQGTGWCFGGPTVSPQDANAVIVPNQFTVSQGASPSQTFDPKTTQALVAFSSDGKAVDLTDKITADGHVNWTADDGTYDLYQITQKPSGQQVKRAAPGGAGPMLNPFYTDAIKRYLTWFDAPFAKSKPKLDAVFQDSYEYRSNWSPDFFEKFEKLRGYKLQDELPALLNGKNDDHEARVKSDYRETISDMMTLDSMPVWVDWAHAHGYQARYQTHGAPGNLLDLYGIADIPETEMILKNRNVLVSKFASSAAHVEGKKYASSETFTWLSEHFTETLAEMKSMADDMFLAGINHIFFHGTAYSPDEVPWPGWSFYASTEMNPRNPVWHDAPALFTYITRCQSMLQSGSSGNDVLIYWPISDVWNNANGMVQNFDVAGQWFESQPIGALAHKLSDRGYAFDYVSDRQLAAMDGKVPAGYKAIVVPQTGHMPVETLKNLVAIAAAGTPVIFDTKLPDDVPGWGNLDARRADFQKLLPQAKQTAHVTIGDVEAGLTQAGIQRETMVDKGLRFVRRLEDGRATYLIVNRGAQLVDDWIVPAKGSTAAELMDPMTGKIGLAEHQSRISNPESAYAVRVQLAPGESIILRNLPNQFYSSSTFPIRPAGNTTPLTGTWNLKFIAGGPTLPASVEAPTLQSWTQLGGADAQTFAGTGVYTLKFDAPTGKGPWSINLGTVDQSARVRLNGQDLGTVIMPPFAVVTPALKAKGNVIEVEVTNVAANRVRDLDIRKVVWKGYKNPPAPGIYNTKYKPFDASQWPLTDSGLLGPVTITASTPN
jgi:hypothetical protein